MRLTDAAIRRAKPQAKPYQLTDGEGLFLLVQPTGKRWWRFAYRFGGTPNIISLGTYPEVSLTRARERRATARAQVADGIDPSQARRARKRQPVVGHTFDAVAAEWLAKQASKWATSTTEKATYHLSPPRPGSAVVRSAASSLPNCSTSSGTSRAVGTSRRRTTSSSASAIYSHLEVTFGAVDGVPRRVPVQMWEWYWQQGSRRDRYVEGLATYDSFRRFTTSVGAPRIAEPPR